MRRAYPGQGLRTGWFSGEMASAEVEAAHARWCRMSMVTRAPAVFVVADRRDAGDHAAGLLDRAGIGVERGPGTPGPGPVLLALRASVPAARGARLRRIHARHAGVPLVATMPEDTPNGLLRRVLQAGADGIVTEESLERSLVPSVQAVAAGQLAVPAKLRRQIAPRHLTYREKQIMGLVVIGYTNRQIADELILAESTVKTHLSSAFAKLEARSRAEAAALVLDPDEGYRLAMAPILAGVESQVA